MVRSDQALLLDMLLACQKLQTFTQDLTYAAFETNELVQSAVLREFQVLGEAARMVSDTGKETYTRIPWKVISGMRNRLIHEYFDIRLDVIWDTIHVDIPDLTSQLISIVPPEPNSPL